MSRTVRQIFNLYPRKGRLAAGSDADVVLLDPRVGHTLGVGSHHSRMDTNIYEGKAVQVGLLAAQCMPVRGAPQMVLASARYRLARPMLCARGM